MLWLSIILALFACAALACAFNAGHTVDRRAQNEDNPELRRAFADIDMQAGQGRVAARGLL